MMLIIEGPDGAGKTRAVATLATLVASELGPVIVQKHSYDTPLEEYLRFVGSDLHVIQDRGWISDEVYGPVVVGETRFPPEFVDECDKALLDCGAVIVHVTADPRMLEQRVQKRGDDYISDDMLTDIVDGYSRAIARVEGLGIPVYQLDTTFSFPSETELRVLLSIVMAKADHRALPEGAA